MTSNVDFFKDLLVQDESLKHYGVLGMKWGVRKDYNSGKGYDKRTITRDSIKASKKDNAQARVARKNLRDGTPLSLQQGTVTTKEVNDIVDIIDFTTHPETIAISKIITEALPTDISKLSKKQYDAAAYIANQHMERIRNEAADFARGALAGDVLFLEDVVNNRGTAFKATGPALTYEGYSKKADQYLDEMRQAKDSIAERIKKGEYGPSADMTRYQEAVDFAEREELYHSDKYFIPMEAPMTRLFKVTPDGKYVLKSRPKLSKDIIDALSKYNIPHETSTIKHTSTTVDDFLAHHGVKGMKWGVRKNREGLVRARSTMTRGSRKDRDALLEMTEGKGSRDKSDKASKFEKKYNKTYRRAQGKIRKSIRRINNDPRYAEQDFRKDSKLRTEYYKDISKAITTQLNASAAKHGRMRKVQLSFDMDVSNSMEPKWSIKQADKPGMRKQIRKDAKESLASLKHSDDEFSVKVKYDDRGFIIDVEVDERLFPEEVLEQSDIDVIDNFLMHHGVKGMKWGVRKQQVRKGRPPSKPNPKPATKTNKPSFKKPARTDILSNDELRRSNERLRLEREYNTLISEVKKQNRSRSKKFVDDVLVTMGKEIVKDLVKSQIKDTLKKQQRPQAKK